MSVLGRIFLLLLAATLVVVTSVGLAGSMGWIPPLDFSFGGTLFVMAPLQVPWAAKAFWWIISLPLLIVSALLTMLALSSSSASQINLRATKGGTALGGDELSVSRRGLVALAVYEAQRIKGVMRADGDIKLKRTGWRVDLDLGLVPGAAIPDVAPLVHEAVGQSLLHHTGVGVDKIRLRVTFGSAGNSKRKVA